MAVYSIRHTVCAMAMSALCMTPSLSVAGGISLGGTRIIYPADQKQVSLSVRNTAEQSSYLVQSWIEQPDGEKNQDFVVTPPLYVSGPGNENTLRLMYLGQPVKTDQETLFYFNTKAIPSMDKKKMEGENILLLAAVTRIKLFVRPAGLKPSPDKAPAELTFHRSGSKLRIDNPTPYHITLAKMTAGGHKLPDTMVLPHGSVSLPLPTPPANTITFRTINDYGAATPELRAEIK